MDLGLRDFFRAMMCNAILVFYERYRPWLQGRFGRETKARPEFWRFCWAIRNAAVHHQGRINFTNSTAAPVTWRGLTYSPADNGKQVFGTDLSVGDLMFLMLGMSDELDTLGAPPP
ncbi:MAG: hypothetical protein JO339_08035 [Alphaproteobacteria bacterium]|nr:hypothetical protein [Alphaproteobacteria bacterium]